jgi:hypothetical protein
MASRDETRLNLTVAGRQVFGARYLARVPREFRTIFWHTLRAYHASTTKQLPLIWTHVPRQIHALVSEYFRLNGLGEPPPPDTIAPRPPCAPPAPLNADRVTVLCSGGKDSVHLAVRLLELGLAPRDLLLVYVPNVNRSESPYERRAVHNVARALGVCGVAVEITNGIKLNRTGHNIGLREQLLLCCALPYILGFGSGRVYFGSMGREWEELHPELYASNRQAHALYADFLADYGIPLTIAPHIDCPGRDERWLLEDFIRRHRELLELTASCYTQANFRERHHALLAAKVPTLPIYQGCGICLKCLRINAGLLLYDEAMIAGPAAERERLRTHILRSHAERFASDARLTELVRALHEPRNATLI